MADYQYIPNMSDPVAQLRMAMDKMDGEMIVHGASHSVPDTLSVQSKLSRTM